MPAPVGTLIYAGLIENAAWIARGLIEEASRPICDCLTPNGLIENAN
jgi:hypothetical protein